MKNNSNFKKGTKISLLLLGASLLIGGNLTYKNEDKTNIFIDEKSDIVLDNAKEKIASEVYTATFYKDGDVYSTVSYTKENYMDKVAPTLPKAKDGHYGYWYPQVDFSIFEDTYYDYMETLEYQVKYGSLKYESGNFVSTKDNTIGIHHEKELTNGVISLDLTKVGGGDSGIVFGLTYLNEEPQTFWEISGVSYYFLYHSNANALVLSKVTDGKYKTLYTIASNVTTYPASIKVSIDDNFIQCFINDNCLIKYTDENKLEGTGIGFRLGKNGSYISNFYISNTPLKEAEDIKGYFLASGKATLNNTTITFSENNTLLYSKYNPIYNREYQAVIKPTNSSKVGFIFGLDTKGETSFYEDKVSYYRYIISETGKLLLEYVDNSSVTTIFNSYQIANFDNAISYHLSIAFINDTVYCYLNQYSVYTYKAPISFFETYHGFISSFSGATIQKLGGTY